jgi:F-type H+-transporting ATPase subunit d
MQHYRAILKNQSVVDEAEKALKNFKPVTYDVGSHIKAIETFEAKAVCSSSILCAKRWLYFAQSTSADETVKKIDEELKDLEATLANIESARPFEDLTVRISLAV